MPTSKSNYFLVKFTINDKAQKTNSLLSPGICSIIIVAKTEMVLNGTLEDLKAA
jgi:hypothetical protein